MFRSSAGVSRASRLRLAALRMLLGAALLMLALGSHVHAGFFTRGAGGCGDLSDAVQQASDGDTILPMVGSGFSGEVSVTKNLIFQGGWSPPPDQCPGFNDPGYPDREALLAAGFTYDPVARAGFGSSRLNLDSQLDSLTLQQVSFDFHFTETPGAGVVGVLVNGAHIRLQNVAFGSNESSEAGGALYLELRNGSRLEIINSEFNENLAPQGGGFEIRVDSTSEVILDNVTVTNNTADTGNGGGGRILLDGGSLTIMNSTFSNNQAANGSGGALSIESVGSSPASVRLGFNSFTGNTATTSPDVHQSGNINLVTLNERVYVPLVSRIVPFARINSIVVANDRYRVSFDTLGFQSQPHGMHVHFFFNTVPPSEAGVPGNGRWLMYDGASPFTEYKPADSPAAATHMCILVANPDHSVLATTGNCYPLR